MAARAFALAACCCAATAQPEFIANVRAYGAVGDGVTLDTAAFVAAVAAVAAARGGVVYVPPGQYLIAPINLTSALELRLDDATIVASARVRGPCQFTDWDVIAPLPSYARGRDFPGPRYTSLLHAYNLSGVRVTSNSSAPGVIDGNGAAWWACIVNGTLKVTPGHLFESLYSTGIVIDNTVWRDSPFWTIHPFASRNIHIYDVRVEAPIHSTNTDGFDPDSSSDVLVERLNVSTGDDCIAIKSGWDGPGVAFGVPSSNITIRGLTCATQSACIAVGSEMSGGVHDVFASGITCVAAGQGFNVKSALGRGGDITNVTFRDATMGAVGTAFAIVTNYRDQYPPFPVNASLIPHISGVSFINVTGVGAPRSIGTAGEFEGLGPDLAAGGIAGVALTDVDLRTAAAGWRCANVTGASLRVTPPPCRQIQ